MDLWRSYRSEEKNQRRIFFRERRGWLTVVGHDWSNFVSSKIRNRNVRWSGWIGLWSIMISWYRRWVRWNSTQRVGHRLVFDDKNLEEEKEWRRSITRTATLTRHVVHRAISSLNESKPKRTRVARWIVFCQRREPWNDQMRILICTLDAYLFLKT